MSVLSTTRFSPLIVGLAIVSILLSGIPTLHPLTNPTNNRDASIQPKTQTAPTTYADNALTHLRQVMDRYLTFDLYTEQMAIGNHFTPSGWMGDITDVAFSDGDTSNPHTGATAIRIDYAATGSQGWAGIYWQEPANNWGNVPDAGFDLTGATSVTFWARGAQGGEKAEFKVGGIGGPYPDSIQPAVSTGILTLSSNWQQYTIDLSGRDLSYVIGGFVWVTNQNQNPGGATIYLDDIRFENHANKLRLLESYTVDPNWTPPRPMDGYRYLYVYNDGGSIYNAYHDTGWMGDYGDIGFNASDTSDPHSGSSAIRIDYSANASQGQQWAGIYWQSPAYNWGDRTGAYNLDGADHVSFWAKGAAGGEKIEFLVGGIHGSYPDSIQPAASTGVVTLTSVWQEYVIDLSNYDLSQVIGGFAWTATKADNPNGATFYLDDIRYINASNASTLLDNFLPSPVDPDSFMMDVGHIYDNALVLLAFLASGDPSDAERAQLLADSLVFAQEHDEINDGRIRNTYYARELSTNTGIARHNYDKYGNGSTTGNVAWAILALLRYYERYGGPKYLNAASSMSQWIVNNTYSTTGAGGYTGGVAGWEPNQEVLTYKSTEHNIDVYVAFMKLYELTNDSVWRSRAMHAKNFVAAMWNDQEGFFYTGTTPDGVTINQDELPLDVNTWGVLSMGEAAKYGRSLTYARVHHQTRDNTSGIVFRGFDFNDDQDGIWFEGTAQMVTALQVVGHNYEADQFLAEVRRAQTQAPHADGYGIVAASQDGLSTGFDLPTGTPWNYYNRLHVGATAWFIFAEQGYNPYWGTSTSAPIPYQDVYQ